MTIASRAALLHAAVADLHAGKLDAAERLPTLADKAGPELAPALRAEAGRANVQGQRLAALGVSPDGPENLWISGILDDAERDAR